jgi:hypothetical protein
MSITTNNTIFDHELAGTIQKGYNFCVRYRRRADRWHIVGVEGWFAGKADACERWIWSANGAKERIQGADHFGGFSEEAKNRLEKLGVLNVHLAITDKTHFLTQYVEKEKLKWEQVLFMGDDLPDLALMNKVGISCCPADAVNEIRAVAKYISPINGGWGCVRDVIEKVLKVNEHWQYEVDVTSR